jgi:hypothetical protein
MRVATETIPRSRPILFRDPMIRAILSGRKTMTRRVVKGVFTLPPLDVDCIKDRDGGPSRLDIAPDDWEICPFGVPGDRLWVRECWARGVNSTVYRADYDVSDGFGSYVVELTTGDMVPLTWKPSIHMRRADSRITLEVIGTRVERLCDISEADAEAEGCRASANYSAVEHFMRLWDSIHGVGSWDRNPWVWCISFRKIESE